MAFGVSFCAREKGSEKRTNTKTLVFKMVVLAGLVAMCGTMPLLAQSPSYPNFSSAPDSSSPPNLDLHGSATTVPPDSPTVLRLTPAQEGQVGSAWFHNLQPVAAGFSTSFTFQISNYSNPPADGIAFVIQNSPAGTTALGGGGGGIGYQGIENSLAIEFDTFANPTDPEYPGDNQPPVAANHVAIQSCGMAANTAVHQACELGLATTHVHMADGNPHSVRIDYTTNLPTSPGCESCLSSYLQVTIDGHAVFEANGVPVDLTQIGLTSLAQGQPLDSAYVGFTGATGALFENNDILNWTFTPHGGQTITQPAPANTFTTFNFGSYLYKVRPDKNIDELTVTEVPTDPGSFSPGPHFRGAQCIVYDSTGGKCIEFHAACSSPSNGACSNVSYDVVTSYDVPTGTISNPGFLKATNQDCPPAVPFDSNIITAFTETRTDPTTKGKSKPSFSCFVAVQGVPYQPADLDIVNLAAPSVRTGANLTYLIPALNFGPASAQAVAITDTIPSGTTFVSAGLCTLTNGCSATPCSVSSGVVTCTLGTMDPFNLQTMVVVVNVTATSGKITDTATATFLNPDPRPADAVSTAVTVINNKRGH
jgi:uncharacterized repeat protein (TIGR01451 family)